MLQTMKSGYPLTVKLYIERQALLERYARTERSLAFLRENSAKRRRIEDIIQEHQINKIARMNSLLLKAAAEDFYSQVARETVKELRESGLIEEDSPLLTEGFWDSVQSAVGNFAGKVGSVLKAVKLKKEPKNWKEAQAVFNKVLDKKSNDLLQKLHTQIQDETKEFEGAIGTKKEEDKVFPVNKTKTVFFQGVNTIAALYDSIVAAVAAKGEGHMEAAVANELIRHMRIMTQKYMADTEREKGGIYATFGGGDEDLQKDIGTLADKSQKTESSLKLADLLFEADDKPSGEEGKKLDPEEEYEKIMSGKKSPVFTRMTSIKLPAVIAGVGALLGGLGWIAYQPWFHDLMLKVLDIPKEETITINTPPQIVAQRMDNLFEIQPEFTELERIVGTVQHNGQGYMGQLTILGSDSAGGMDLRGPNVSVDDYREFLTKFGHGDLNNGIETASQVCQKGPATPEMAARLTHDLFDHPEKYGITDTSAKGSVWKFFAHGTGRGGGAASVPLGGFYSVLSGAVIRQKIFKAGFKVVATEAAKSYSGFNVVGGTTSSFTAKTAAASSMTATFMAAGTIAGFLGITLVVAGATVIALRKKAKKSSRLATLNTLLQQLDYVNEDGNKIPDSSKEATAALEFKPEVDKEGNIIPPKPPGGPAPKTAAAARNITDKDNTIEFPEGELGPGGASPRAGAKAKSEEPTPDNDPKPPKKLNPKAVAKAGKVVVVFGDDALNVWRVLKKNTIERYMYDSKRMKDEDGGAGGKALKDRLKDYDSILQKLDADGLFVNDADLITNLSKISKGKEGEKLEFPKVKRLKGDEKQKTVSYQGKGKIGGYYKMKDVSSIEDIKNKAKLSAKALDTSDPSKSQVVYLVSNSVISDLASAGMKEDEAKSVVQKAIKAWSAKGNKPKLADIGAEGIDDKVHKILKKTSLTEAFGFRSNRHAVVEVTTQFLRRVIGDLALSR